VRSEELSEVQLLAVSLHKATLIEVHKYKRRETIVVLGAME
jgi:hypothetical protein